MPSSVLDEGLGGIAPQYRGWMGVTADRVRQSARATPHIEPVNALGDPQPGYEPRCKLSAPPAHEIFVG